MNIKHLLLFVTGAAVGSGATYLYLKKKFDEERNAEIEQMMGFTPRTEPINLDKIPVENEVGENDMKQDHVPGRENISYQKFASKPRSVLYTSEDEVDERAPYVIHPDEFGDIEEYERDTLYLYTDGRIADEDNYLIEDVEGTLGSDALERIGEYEADAAYVINHRFKSYYEILISRQSYVDILNQNPHVRKRPGHDL